MRLHLSYVYSNDAKHLCHIVIRISCNFFLQFLVVFELCFPPTLNLKITLRLPLNVFLISLFTLAWMFRETTTHVTPPDSSGLMPSGWCPSHLNMQTPENVTPIHASYLHINTLLILFPSCFPPQVEGVPSFAGNIRHQAINEHLEHV